MDNVVLINHLHQRIREHSRSYSSIGGHMKEYGVDNPTLTDNFSKKAEINSDAFSTRCYLSRILPNKKPKYAAITNRHYWVIFDVVLTCSFLQSKVWS